MPRVEGIDGKEFFGEFVDKRRPVVIRGLTSEWRALDWGLEYFRRFGDEKNLAVKLGNVAEGRRERVSLAGYSGALEQYEAALRGGEPADMPGYLHDVPLFRIFPSLIADVQPFPLQLFPEWYRENWQEYVQYFMGPTRSVTPLHFDTLLTNNLFFHLAGRKRFILVPADQRRLCYTHRWRWAKFDPADPDFEAFPLAKEATAVSVVLEPGEILYLPPGTLHHVTNLTLTMSFNIDWHTPASARLGVASVLQGAPMKNAYYNLLSYVGLGLGVPDRYIFPFYRSYLTYVS
ncbi:cupin-like domain-containing protein [Catellatospora coxensis]|uniref:cupin-like domain-containing protein n=1 Tax=Catellatospora coxensis TaxID=310354 RepID=UPI0031E208C0